MDDLISRKSLLEKTYMADVLHAIKGITKSVEVVLADDVEVAPSAFEGMTNGEVFQTIFPNASVFENQDNEPYPYIDVFLCGDKDMNCYRKDWWNAPYKAESEGV